MLEAGTRAPGQRLLVIEMRSFLPATCLLSALAAGPALAGCAAFEIMGDGIPHPLGGQSGTADAGRQVAADRQRGDCSICHRLPLPNARFHGNVGPDLTLIGARLTASQIRLRVASNRRINPESVMPDYCTSSGRHQVASAYADQPLLSDQEIEDVVAWLSSLDGREP